MPVAVSRTPDVGQPKLVIPRIFSFLLLTRGVGWIEDVDIDGYVDTGFSDPILDAGNDALCTDLVDGSGGDQVEAAADVVAEVALWPNQGCPDASVNGGVLDEALVKLQGPA